jgi:hypothetical protein
VGGVVGAGEDVGCRWQESAPGAEAEGVVVGVGDVELAGAPGLVEGREVDGGVEAVGLVEAAGGVAGEEGVDFGGVVELEVDGAGGWVAAHVDGELEDGGVVDEVEDAVAQGELAVGGVAEGEVEDGGVEGEGTVEIAGVEDGDGVHVDSLHPRPGRIRWRVYSENGGLVEVTPE